VIIGNLAGTTVQKRLGYVLPMGRRDFHTGLPITKGMMLQAPFRGKPGGNFPVNQGASNGGEGALPETAGDDLFQSQGGSGE
jgi:hypothetical protein